MSIIYPIPCFTSISNTISSTMGLKRKDKNIILDIDGTLIDSVPADYAIDNHLPKPDIVSPWGDFIYKRPHLDTFLEYCVENFKNIAIWTAGDDTWADLIVSKVLEPSLKKSKKGKRLVSSAGNTPCSSPLRRRHNIKEVELTSGSDDEDELISENESQELEEEKPFSFVYTFNRCKPVIIKDKKSKKSYQFYSKPLKKIWQSKKLREMGFTRQTTLIIEDTPENCIDNYGNAVYISPYDITNPRSRFDSSLLKIQHLFSQILDTADIRAFEKRGWENMNFPKVLSQSTPDLGIKKKSVSVDVSKAELSIILDSDDLFLNKIEAKYLQSRCLISTEM